MTVLYRFVSEDGEHETKLVECLNSLKKERIVSSYKGRLVRNSQLLSQEEVEPEINEADVIVFLVSQQFIQSLYYKKSVEAKEIQKRCWAGLCTLLLVPVEDCCLSDFDDIKCRVLPENRELLVNSVNLNEAWHDIAGEIKEVCQLIKLEGESKTDQGYELPDPGKIELNDQKDTEFWFEGYTIDRLEPAINHIAWSANRKYVATGDENKQILVWKIASSSEDFVSQGYKKIEPLDLLENGMHQRPICSLAWSPDGRRLASGGLDHHILIWDIDFDIETHQRYTHKLRGHRACVTDFAWVEENRLLSADSDGNIFVWNPKSGGDRIDEFKNQNKPILCMSSSPSGSLVATGSSDGVVRIYAWETKTLLCKLPGHSGDINSVVWESESMLASASEDKEIRLWDLSNFQSPQVKVLTGHTQAVLSISFSPDRRVLASQSADMTLKFWDVEYAIPLDFRAWQCSVQPNIGMTFDKEDSLLLSMGNKDHVFRISKIVTETLIKAGRSRSTIDNVVWNQIERVLLSDNLADDEATCTFVSSACEEAGFSPWHEQSELAQGVEDITRQSNLFLGVYSGPDDLYDWESKVKELKAQSKSCYFFFKNVRNLDSELSEKQLDKYRDCLDKFSEEHSVQRFSDHHDLRKKIVTLLKRRLLNKRELISSADGKLYDIDVDFVIVVATTQERDAIFNAFSIDAVRAKRSIGSRIYWHASLPIANDKAYNLVVAQTPDVASVDAALLTAAAINDWKPSAVLMVGIAAATSPTQQLGDIILGKDVYYYDRGKVSAEGTMLEPIMHPADATLWSRATSLLPATDFEILADRPDQTDQYPTVTPAVIASGEKVIADAEFRDAILRQHRNIKAIEMEGYGVSTAAHQSSDKVRCLVIRALCDYADSAKDNTWQAYAAAAAAGFVKHFLLDGPLEPKGR